MDEEIEKWDTSIARLSRNFGFPLDLQIDENFDICELVEKDFKFI